MTSRIVLVAFLFVLIPMMSMNAQNQDSLKITLGDEECVIHEEDIQSWDWEFQSIALNNSVTPYGTLSLRGEYWKISIGDLDVIEGKFGEKGCSECLQHIPLVMMYLPFRTISSLRDGRLTLYFFGSSESEKNPLYNPILLDHLVRRNLIPAEYRLQCLLKWLGIPWKPMK